MSDYCVAAPLTEEQKDKLIKRRNQQLEEYAEKIIKLEKRASKNFDAYMRCSKKYTELKNQLTKKNIQLLEEVKAFFVEECEDGDGCKTEDWSIIKDAVEIAEFIEDKIKTLKEKENGR